METTHTNLTRDAIAGVDSYIPSYTSSDLYLWSIFSRNGIVASDHFVLFKSILLHMSKRDDFLDSTDEPVVQG